MKTPIREMIESYFVKQIEMNPETKMYFYAIERLGENPEFPDLELYSHRGSLDDFPNDLEYLRMSTEMLPVFRKAPIRELIEKLTILKDNADGVSAEVYAYEKAIEIAEELLEKSKDIT